MAKQETIDEIKNRIEKILNYREKGLIHRSEWGTISFESAANDIEKIFRIVGELNILPIEILTDQAANSINKSLDQVTGIFNSIDTFIIEQDNPTNVRNSLVSQTVSLSDGLFTAATPWIPYLAYQKGDVAENISALAESVTESRNIVEVAKNDIEKKYDEIEDIIIKAREASAQAGAAVFTRDFDDESTRLNTSATQWLRATALLAVGTLLVAGTMFLIVEPNLTQSALIQKLGTKIIILITMFTATLWCGRIYKALMHQSTLNKHRALSLQTFQAFSAAGSDEQTKNAVLIETTRSIFTAHDTGYLDGKSAGSDSSAKIVEISKLLSAGKG